MVIKFDVQKVAKERGMTTAYQLQKALDSYPSEAAKLWNGRVKQVSLTMLGRLCEVLQCAPGDFFVREDTEGDLSAEASPSEPTPAKLTAAQKQAIADEQQRRWRNETPGKKAAARLTRRGK